MLDNNKMKIDSKLQAFKRYFNCEYKCIKNIDESLLAELYELEELIDKVWISDWQLNHYDTATLIEHQEGTNEIDESELPF